MTIESESPFTAQSTPAVKPTGCCPPFDPATFQEKEVAWNDKLFVKEHVHSIFHVPLDMNRKVVHAMRLIDAAHAAPAQPLMLGDERSPWSSDLYIDVNGPVPGAETVRISGKFLTRVYEGPYRDTAKWMADMTQYVTAKGLTPKKMYLGYTTCPKCSKAYGKNYVVLFAQVDSGASS